MNNVFENAINIYYNVVKEACEFFMMHIGQKEKLIMRNKYELYLYLHSKREKVYCIENRKYMFHGFGCTLFLNEDKTIDWDFGYRSLWCGIDPYKMAKTLKNVSYDDSIFYDGKYIKKLCDENVAEGFMKCYKNQYYVDFLKKGMKQQFFPKAYDALIVQYRDKERIYKKSKEIDSFIRKGKMVYKDIEKLDDNYMLTFIKDKNEVGKFLYNDIAYHDKAVKIMNDIIKPYQVYDWM